MSLLVAAPSEEKPDGFVMPSFVGMPIVTAQAILQKVGLSGPAPEFVDVHVPDVAGANAGPPKPPAPPGSVVAQQPVAGAFVEISTPVKFTVAK